MKLRERIKQASEHHLLHLHLVEPEKSWLPALLGLVTGIVAGAAMVAFRLVIETPQALFLGPDHAEDYGRLTPLWRLLLATAGGLLVGLVFQQLAKTDRQVGVVHVMERLAYGEAHLPIKNAIVQFFAAAACIIAGHSVGREGPSIHIGAACGSWMGQRLHLPHNSIRILVGCGTAGGIAATFDTPLAGVIFVMEVIMVEYTIASFIPIILAAVSATAISRSLFGTVPAFFSVPNLWDGSATDLLYIILMGVLIGTLSTAFIRLLMFFSTVGEERPLWLRMTLAGLLTGLLAVVVPEIMGSGTITVNGALMGELGLGLLLAVLVCKVMATALGLGLGLPGGVIGPTLVIGAVAGGALGVVFEMYFPGHNTSPTFFTMLGMGAMMGATLNAPLAALTALLELTANPQIIMPGMLVIVTASLTNHRIFKTPSVFLNVMQARGLDYPTDPLVQLLRRLGVVRCMESNVLDAPRRIDRRELETTLAKLPTWLLIHDPETRPTIVFAADVMQYLEANPEEVQFDLFEISAHRLEVAPISVQATLLGALQAMERQRLDALYVTRPPSGHLLGVVTRADIERIYHYSYPHDRKLLS